MKWRNFRIRNWAVSLCLLWAALASLSAQEAAYQKRVERYRKFWAGLVPNYYKLQYAGSMGFLSLGTGWDYGKNNQWETDVFLGFVPRFSTDEAKITFTLKQNFIPWKMPLGTRFSLDPLSCGLYLNSVFNDEFWVNEPDKYPSGYYPFSTKLRINIFIGQRITYLIPQEKMHSSKSITFFYEISTNELYLISRIQNRTLKPKDYLGLSLGLKMQLF